MSALESLWGDGHLNATRTRECVAMPGVREQRVYTPGRIVSGLLEFWPGGPEYDPCSGPDSIVPSRRRTETRGLIDRWPDKSYGNPCYGKSLFDPERSSLAWDWEQRERVRCKALGVKPKWPPGYPLAKHGHVAGLRDWLAMHLAAEGEAILLVPNRSHRLWLRAWKRNLAAVIELDPLTFAGHVQAFPAPLVLGLKAAPHRVPAFVRAFKHVGEWAT